MPRKTRKCTGVFEVEDESGNVRTLYEYTEFIEIKSFGQPVRRTSGRRELLTNRGEKVNRLDKGKYQIVATGEILKSDDPEAP